MLINKKTWKVVLCSLVLQCPLLPPHTLFEAKFNEHGYELGHILWEEQVQPWHATRSPATLKHEQAVFWTAQ